MLVVSKSSLERAPGCPRALAWMFKHNLRKAENAEYFVTGRAFHAGLAAYYRGADEAASIQAMRQVAQDEEAERLLSWYICHAEDEDWNPVAVEVAFSRKIGPGVVVGVLDLVMEREGKLWLVDHKTARSVGASYFAGVERDPQALLYQWAALREGFPIEGFMLNVVKKTKEPEIIRYTLPVDHRRIDWMEQHLEQFVASLAELPESHHEIIALPGNPMACRGCPFAEVCELDADPDQAVDTLELLLASGDIERRQYDAFGVMGGEP